MRIQVLEGGEQSMAQAPKDITEATDLIKAGWNKYAAAASFGGMTEAQFETKVKPSYDLRAQIADLESQITQLIQDRDAADVVTNKANAAVVKGIVGDPNYGDDSDLYGTCGYVRKSERASGLTRKKTAVAKATVAGK